MGRGSAKGRVALGPDARGWTIDTSAVQGLAACVYTHGAMGAVIKTNLLYFGDNLGWLRDQGRFPDESVDLVYLDPPFNSNRNYNVLFKDSPTWTADFGQSSEIHCGTGLRRLPTSSKLIRPPSSRTQARGLGSGMPRPG